MRSPGPRCPESTDRATALVWSALDRLAEGLAVLDERLELVCCNGPFRTLREAKDAAERELQLAQRNPVHAEKMAALGQLTAGIAHEMRNPPDFVNNFAATSTELVEAIFPALEAMTGEAPSRPGGSRSCPPPTARRHWRSRATTPRSTWW